MSINGQSLKIGEWLLDPNSGQLSRQDKSVFLDHTPLQLLLCLAEQPGKDISKEFLLDKVWKGKVVGEEVLTVAVSQIRKQLGDNARRPVYIKTISGVGYRLLVNPEYVAPEPKGSSVWRLKAMWAIPVVIAFGVWLSISLMTKEVKPTAVVTLPSLPQATQDMFRKSRFLITRETPQALIEAQNLLQQVIADTPDFPLAYLELAKIRIKEITFETRLQVSQLDELYGLLQKVIDKNNGHADAFFLYGRLAFFQEMDITKAEQHFLEALRYSPDHAPTHRMLAQLYLACSEFELAMKHTRRYVDLSPEAYEVPTVAWIFNMMGDYQRALVELSKLEKLRPDSWVFSVSAQSILENMDKQDESFVAMQEVFRHVGFSQEEKDTAALHFQRGGLEAVYKWLLQEQREIRNIGQYSPPLAYARFAAKSGNMTLARNYLEQAFKKKQVQLLWLNVDPKYKSLRDTPEFAKIVSTLKLEKEH